MRATEHADVVIVGAGPVGLSLARMLGLRGHSVIIVERWPEPYPLPRAVHYDHEIARQFQAMGLMDEVSAISLSNVGFYEWRNARRELLLALDFGREGASGWSTANFSQPDLERVLRAAVAAMPQVELLLGHEAVGLTDHGTHVDVDVVGPEGVTTQSGRYVVGCDGTNSVVRSLLGIEFHDLGFQFDWLIVDAIPLDDADFMPANWQLCDPARPTTIVSGGPGRRRWEFMRLPRESIDELNTEESAWRLLEPWGRTRDNTELERHAVYTFQARWAETWNLGRVMLAGDAAHQMPPFAGQGMCSGIRDAANLAWKLDLVLREGADQAILDTYTSERLEHLRHAIAISVELGKVICVLDPDQAAARDAAMLAAGPDPRVSMPPLPPERLGDGLVWRTSDLAEDLAGTLAPQFWITCEGARVRFDDVVESGFVLLTHGPDPSPALTERERRLAARLGVRMVSIGPPGTDADVIAADDAARDYFTQHGVASVLVRPDFYVFGVAADAADVGPLISRLRETVAPGLAHT